MNAESTREALDVASLAGDILLASGAEIFRVEEREYETFSVK